MNIKPAEIKLINTRQDVVDFIYFLYLNHDIIDKYYIFDSSTSSSDSVPIENRYIEISFDNKCKTIKLYIQISNKYKLGCMETHSYTCTMTDFINTKNTGAETNDISMILNVLYDSKDYINKVIKETYTKVKYF